MPLEAPPREVMQFFAPYIADFLQRASAVYYGGHPFQITGWWRSVRSQANARVQRTAQGLKRFDDGSYSQHTSGTAFDLAPPRDPKALWTAFQRVGLIPVWEGNVFHVQLWPRGTLDSLMLNHQIQQLVLRA